MGRLNVQYGAGKKEPGEEPGLPSEETAGNPGGEEDGAGIGQRRDGATREVCLAVDVLAGKVP
jgi:hypothetical protein